MTTEAELPPVVVGIDGSDTALGAAAWAADYAARHALPLVLVHVIPRLDLHFVRSDQHPELSSGSDGDALLDAAADAVRATHPDLDVRVLAVRGAVAPTLAGEAVDARLLVVGKGSSEHRALGGQTIKVVYQASCPVLVWRPPLAKRTGKPLPVVVGIDDSDASRNALAEAFDIARKLHAPLTVAHMWEITPAVGMGDLGGEGNMDWQLLEVLEAQQRRQVDDMVKPLADNYPNAHVNEVFKDATPAKGLADLSGAAQLVVVGRHGRGRVAEALMGSVSQNLIHHAECPVLVVR